MNNFMKRVVSIKLVFILLVFLTALVVMVMLFPDAGLMHGPWIFILWGLHALSGVGLVILTYRQKIAGKAKLFLLLAGFSAAGFVLGGVLHNVFYALAILAEDLKALNIAMNILEVGFFLIAVVACPIGLLAGIVGTFVLWKRLGAEEKKV